MARSFPLATSLPGRRRHQVAVGLAATLLASSAALAPLASADDLDDKKKEAERERQRAAAEVQESSAAFAAAQQRLAAAQQQLSAAQSQLATTRGQLQAARVKDAQMQKALEVAVAELARAREDLRLGQEAVARQRVLVDDTVARMYEGGGTDMAVLSGMLESRGLEDMTWALSSGDAINDEQKANLDALEAAEVVLRLREAKVEEKKVEVERQRVEAAKNLEHMRALEAAAVAQTKAVSTLVSQRQAATSQAEAARAADLAELARWRNEEAKISAMLRARAAAAAAAAAKSGGGGGGGGGGFLSYPVKGYVTSPYGYRTHPIYGYYSLHNGVDFGTGGCGAPLYATANGVVVSTYFSSVWGNRLIVDHGYARGVGVASIYNHATRYTVRSGQRVTRGQVVGYVGSTGWSTGCHLHFTVTENGNPVDPMKWF